MERRVPLLLFFLEINHCVCYEYDSNISQEHLFHYKQHYHDIVIVGDF